MTLDERKTLMTPLATDLLKLRGKAGHVAIYPHLNADGDAYGSCQALVLALNKLDISAVCVLEEEIKEDFLFLPGIDRARIWPKLSEDEQTRLTDEQLMAIQVDLSVEHRLADRRDAFTASAQQRIIDHHVNDLEPSPDHFIDTQAAASSELVYSLVEALGAEAGVELLDQDMALCLYTGLIMDTGNFSYPNVRPTTFSVAASLLATGINVPDVVDRLLRRISWARYRVEGALRSQTKRTEDGKITYLGVSSEFMREFGAADEDLESIPGQLRDIEGTEIALMLRQTPSGDLRGNLRSQPDVDIQGFAASLDGGGHKNAAGFTLPPQDLDETLADLVSKLQKIVE